MFRVKMYVVFFALVSLIISGCTGAQRGAVVGGVSGSALGAAGPIGTFTGIAHGAAIGNETVKDRTTRKVSEQLPQVIETCPNIHQVDVTGFPSGTRVRCPVCTAIFEIE
jgi:uncharacterized protein YcfJ